MQPHMPATTFAKTPSGKTKGAVGFCNKERAIWASQSKSCLWSEAAITVPQHDLWSTCRPTEWSNAPPCQPQMCRASVLSSASLLPRSLFSTHILSLTSTARSLSPHKGWRRIHTAAKMINTHCLTHSVFLTFTSPNTTHLLAVLPIPHHSQLAACSVHPIILHLEFTVTSKSLLLGEGGNLRGSVWRFMMHVWLSVNVLLQHPPQQSCRSPSPP